MALVVGCVYTDLVFSVGVVVLYRNIFKIFKIQVIHRNIVNEHQFIKIKYITVVLFMGSLNRIVYFIIRSVDP